MPITGESPSQRVPAAAATPAVAGPATQPVLRAEHLTKSFAGNIVLDDVTFETLPGEIHALVGENGAGKSTLINLITGVYAPDHGTIHIGQQQFARLDPRTAEAHGVAAVFQELSLCPHLTVAENVFLGRTPTRFGHIDYLRIQRESADLFAELGVTIDPKVTVRELSLANQQMVELAKALSRQPRILILDEATSALDHNQVELLFAALRRLRERGVSTIFVSHRMEEIFAISDRITVLKNGELVVTVEAAGTTTDQLVQYMVGRSMHDIFPAKPPIEDVQAAEVVLSVRHLSAGRRFHDVSFDLHRGEILGLGGLQGQGQRELLQALFGLVRSDGEVKVGQTPIRLRGPRRAMDHNIAYVPEDRKTEGLLVPLSAAENLVLPNLGELTNFGWVAQRRTARLVDHLIERLQVRLRSPHQAVRRLSGGNQQKIAIAKWLPLQQDVYLLAEPTRGIDVGTKQEIYRLMRELTAAGAGIILISSDTIELLGLSDRVLVMYERQPVTLLTGSEVTEERVVHASVTGQGGTAAAAPLPLNASAELIAGAPAKRDMLPRTRPGWLPRLSALPRSWQDVAPIYAITLIFVLVYVFLNRTTISIDSLNNLSAYIFPLCLTAMGQSVIMLTGGIDLSTGAMVSVATVLLATQMYDSIPSMVKAVVIVLAAGAGLGMFTGLFVAVAKLPAIIVTLATSFMWGGLALFILSTPGGHLPARFASGMIGQIGGVIPVTVVVLAAALIVWKVIKTTPLGLSIYAVGDNPAGAFVSGIPVRWARIAAYAIAGAMTVLGGIGLAAYSGTGDPTIGTPYTLASIAIAVLGGISFFGGEGQLKGTIAGAVLMGLLIQILFISGLSPSYQQVIQGLILIVALGVKAVASFRIEEAR